MSNTKIRFADRLLAVVLAVMMVIGLMPITAFASVGSVIKTDIGKQTFKVGVPTEFTFSTVANGDEGIQVVGSSDFSDPDAVEKLEYYEVKDGKWYVFSGDFGGSTGFPMSDATSKFRVTFKKAGSYSFTAMMKRADNGSVLCSTKVDITVSGKTPAEVSSDIKDKTFVTGVPTEFSIETKANDFAGTAVIGTFDFSDPDAVEKLEYYETANGTWCELSGDFGFASGSSLNNATSKFRVTFNKAGEFSFRVLLKYADGENEGNLLVSSERYEIGVKEKHRIFVSSEGQGSVTLNGNEIGEAGISAVEGDTVSLSVAAADGWQISSVAVGGESKSLTSVETYKQDITVAKADIEITVKFVKVYTVTVEYDRTKGSVVPPTDSEGGIITVKERNTIDIVATPKDGYRVARVEITDKNTLEFTDNEYNSNNPYATVLSADRDYTVKITFAPYVYGIDISAGENGTVTTDKTTVESGDDAKITITPAQGYTVDRVLINGSDAYASVRETDNDESFELVISDIKEKKAVNVTFRKCETAGIDTIKWNSSDSLRTDETSDLYVFAKDATVTFTTEKQGMRITDLNGCVYGDKQTKTVSLSESVSVEKIEVWFDFGWHEVTDGEKTVKMKLVFDGGKPTAEIKAVTEPLASGYYNSDVTLEVSVVDTGDFSGIDYVEYRIVCGDKTTEPEKIYSYKQGGEIKSTLKIDDLKIVAADNNSEKVTVYVKAADRAGNVSEEKSVELKICTTAPSVSIEFYDKQSDDADPNDVWYNTERSARISITDRADVFDKTTAENGIVFEDGSAVDYVMSDWTDEGDVHTADVTFTGEGTYKWSYSYIGKAAIEPVISESGDNVYYFKIDKTAPFGTITAQSKAWNDKGFDWGMLLEKITFGLYSNKEITVGLQKNAGQDLLSGFRRVDYYMSESDEALSEEALKELYAEGKFSAESITVSHDAQFTVYARITDNAGNVTFIGTNGVIYDGTAGKIQIELEDKPNENAMYGVESVKSYTNEKDETVRGIKANINVTDLISGTSYSGIKKVEYAVFKGNEQTQSGTLYEFNNAAPEKNDLKREWSGFAVIDADKNNGKNIKLTVTVTDNAGNTAEENVTVNEINIDDISAVVTVTGTAVNKVDDYGWYNSARTAVIIIKDRASAFDPEAATKSIVFEKTDKDGNRVQVAPDDVTVSAWTNSDDLHTAVVTFSGDGRYSWHIDYTNKAGNKLSEDKIEYGLSESPKEFTVDKGAPHGTVKVGESSWTDKIIPILTFGIFGNKNYSVNVESFDENNISPVTVEYYIHHGNSRLDEDDLKSLYNGGAFSAEEPGPEADTQFAVYVRVTDMAGNYVFVSSDGVISEAKSADVTVKAVDEPNEKGYYGKSDVAEYDGVKSAVRIAVKAKEADSVEDTYSGIKQIRYEVKSRNSSAEEYSITQSGVLYSFEYERNAGDNSNGGKLTIRDVNAETITYNDTDGVPSKEMLCREWNGMIVVDAEKNNCCDTAVIVYVTDNAGNEKTEKINLDIDLTPPAISVRFDNNSAQNETYFNAQRTATVVIAERPEHFDAAKATEGIKITAKYADGKKDVENAYVLSGWKLTENKAEPDKSTFTATVLFKEDANFTFGISYADRAGNVNTAVNTDGTKAPFKFTVDTAAPNGTVSVNDSVWSTFFNVLTFGLFDNKKATVHVTADDAISPVKIEYFKSNGDLGLNSEELSSAAFVGVGDYSVGKQKTLFEIDSDEQFNVYVRITDKAGQITVINSDGYIVDTVKSRVSVYPVTAPNDNNIYGIKEVGADGGVKLRVDVNDIDDGSAQYYSGISSVSYTVSALLNERMTETQPETILYKFDKPSPSKADLLTEFTGEIIIDPEKNNSSKVIVTVKVTDNAGNVNTDSVELDINVTAPAIKLSFDNNSAVNGTYFNAPRTATVEITERTNHFDSVAATNGIKITAKDVNGNDVAYSVSGWTDKANGSDADKATHIAHISFENDANYTLSVSYTGKSGNANSSVDVGDSTAPYIFTVDTTPPDAEISINGHIWDRLLQILTFGLYSNVRADVKIEGSDKTSPFVLEYYKTNDPVIKDDGSENPLYSALNSLYAGGKFKTYKKFSVNPDEQFVVFVRATDSAGNFRYISSDGYIVDGTAPQITLITDNAKDVYNTDVKMNIGVTDAVPYSGIAKIEYRVVKDGSTETQRQTLFDFRYTRTDGENANGGTLTVTDWADGTEKKTTITGNVPTKEQLVGSWNGSFVVNAALNNSSNVKVFVGVTDNAGNYSEQSFALDIDVTEPSIKVTYSDTANENAKNGYYTSRTATVEITERTAHFDAAAATKGISVEAVDFANNKVNGAYTVSAWTTKEGATPDDAVHTATVTYGADANYTFGIAYTDKAGNKNLPVNTDGQKNPYSFTVDKNAPTGTVTAKAAEGRTEIWSSIVDPLTFGFWSNSRISVDSSSSDKTSPVQSVEYYMYVAEAASDNTKALSAAELDAVDGWQTFKPFSVTENMQFTVYFKITDNAGNYTYISTNGLIVDEEHPVEETVAPEISVSPAQPVNGIYSGDVKVTVEVVDPMVGGTYSGLKEISYAVFDRDSEDPNEPTQEGTLYSFGIENPKQSELLQKWRGEITVSAAKNNSNNIQVVIYAKDNSLNAVDNSQKEAKSYTVIKIDTTAPVIDISYDNNNADSGTYFNANRTATITVTERNFNADDVKIALSNTDGDIPAVVGWTHTNGTLNGDDAKHIATIAYAADGDYTFAVDYTDLAGNKCNSVNYADGTVAGSAFTIDKTAPTVNVSYNNNSAVNANYYRDARTATITITEHNFGADRVNITTTATDDGKPISLPAVNGWANNGDVHTATVTFANDALYTFDIAYTDMAGNKAADYRQDTFYVDKTDPVLDISPETLNGSANNGEVKPIVSSSDTNFDQVQISLSGANHGEIKQLNGAYSDISNGRVFTFANFTEEKDTDDIYTLSATVTDKAGRSTTKSVSFSVNRFGSVYSIDKTVAELNNSYVKEAQDVTVTEINANELSNIKITLFKNNETIILAKDKDYRIDITGGNGQWYKYVYTVFAKNFAEDGVYRLVFHSEDSAGNIAENTLDTKDTEISFGVDSTPPVVNINNLSDGATYALDNMTVNMSISDNLNLEKITVYLDGNEHCVWSGENIESLINDGGNFTFDISGDSTDAHTVKIVAVDAAGNEMTKEVKNFYVTTNLWVRFYTNKPAFYGSISGVVVIAAAAVFFAVIKRRKEEKDK